MTLLFLLLLCKTILSNFTHLFHFLFEDAISRIINRGDIHMERVYIKRSFGEHDRVADAGPPPNTLLEHHQSTAERESVTQKLLVSSVRLNLPCPVPAHTHGQP